MMDFSKMKDEELMDSFVQLVRSEEYYRLNEIDYDTWCCDFDACGNEIILRMKDC